MSKAKLRLHKRRTSRAPAARLHRRADLQPDPADDPCRRRPARSVVDRVRARGAGRDPSCAVSRLASAPRPKRADWRPLAAVVSASSSAFRCARPLACRPAASHGAIVIGVLPLATALFAAWLGGERPSRAFWLLAVAAASSSSCLRGAPAAAGSSRDLWLLAAVALGALGYAEGGRLARTIGGRKSSAGAGRQRAAAAAPGRLARARQTWPVDMTAGSPSATSRCFPSSSDSLPGTAAGRGDWRALDRSSCCRCS